MPCGLRATTTAGPRNSMTDAARRFCSKTWKEFVTDLKLRTREYKADVLDFVGTQWLQIREHPPCVGSGANFIKCIFGLASGLLRLYAAKTAAQSLGAVVAFPVSGLRLNCCFLIFSADWNAADSHGRRLESLESEHRLRCAALSGDDLARPRCLNTCRIAPVHGAVAFQPLSVWQPHDARRRSRPR